MRLRVQEFFLHKAGNQPEEYEDAWDYDEGAKRLAIADGASDAIIELRISNRYMLK